MQQQVSSNPRANIRLYVIWIGFYTWDAPSDIDPSLFQDPRVDQFWDPHQVSGRWFAATVSKEGDLAWDVYFLYGTSAQWDSEPGPLAGSGSPVIANTDQLAVALRTSA